MQKHIVCLGDSNTHGYCADPNDCADPQLARFNEDERWTMLLEKKLGTEYKVYEEGLSGRTTVFPDPLYDGLDSLHYLWPCLKSHEPVSLLIIMLGTNDTKPRFSVSSGEITEGMSNLIRKLRFYYPVNKYPMPPVLLAAPGPLAPAKEEYAFDASSARKVRELPARYEALAKELGCLYFNAQTVLTEADLGGDGIHLKTEGHVKLAQAFTAIVKDYFSKA